MHKVAERLIDVLSLVSGSREIELKVERAVPLDLHDFVKAGVHVLHFLNRHLADICKIFLFDELVHSFK